MPTKDYSSKQECMISDILGWNTVVASGARNFHPGDIQSSKWLGECKTHVTASNEVVFKIDEWKKIELEAQSEFKVPILFVDNGSQKADDTWVLFDPSVVSGDFTYDEYAIEDYKHLRDIITIRKNVILKDARSLRLWYNSVKSSESFTVISFYHNPVGKRLAICNLYAFVDIFGEGV